MPVENPATGATIAQVALSGAADVDAAVQAAKAAHVAWSNITVKSRCTILMKFWHLVTQNEKNKEELIQIVIDEHGKTRGEAIGSINKGMETVEWACSLPQLAQGRILEVSRGVQCAEVRESMGVCASIVPFNFPVMVPMWTLPICIGLGNCIIVKPSEKVPMTMHRVIDFLHEAGVPKGVVQIVNGAVDVVNAICDHPDIKAVSFVGSTKVAKIVSTRCRNTFKRAVCMGGAKNHLVAMPDCNIAMCAHDITASFVGCCGQRCMAASVLLTVGENQPLIDAIVAKAAAFTPGNSDALHCGPVIDRQARDRIVGYINEAEKGGAKILLDGRGWATGADHKEACDPNGHWVGPTVILHSNKTDKALHDEIFGPVLSIYQVANKEEAIEIENGNPYGNAACIYTESGATAAYFQKRFSVGMVGVNVGVPVPREPFSFGGSNDSKIGDFDITGDGAMNFFSKMKKVTTKWNPPKVQDWMS
jgi:methylmalonic acid semialdehyde dehydrogenase